MAWTSGFFNSVGGDRVYNADQMSELFTGLITNGVYESVKNKLAVEPNSGMTIQINTGRGWFNGRWVDNNSAYLYTLEGSDVLLNRYCAVCVRVDLSETSRKAEPYFKYSEFATTPVKPEMERTGSIYEYCLAYIYIKANATTISAADIEDTRGNTELCGWVTGLIDQVNTSTLWTQWDAQFHEWFDNLADYLDENTETKLVSDVAQLQEDVANLGGGHKKYTGTFDGLGWSSSGSGYYTQTVTVEGITASDYIIILPTSEYKEAYVSMGCEAIGQADNAITFRCINPADTNMVIEVIVIEF
jgi:hypothetical protein